MSLEGKRINELTEVSKVDTSSKLVIDTGGAEALSITLKNLIDSSGVGSVDIATTEKAGIVKPDGTTISVSSDGTISFSGSGFDFEGTKAEFNAAVAAGTITDDSISLITDDVSGDNVATKAELQDRVSKAGDTMTGNLKISGNNEVRFGTDDYFYHINKEVGSQYLTLYHKNGKGLLINGDQNGIPYYYDGTNYSRLLTTADLANIDYVVESQANADGSWYRKYKSGWIEQGGLVNVANATVTFPKPFSVGPATLLLCSANTASAYTTKPTSVTATSFVLWQYQGHYEPCYWYACGQGA